MVYTIKLTTTSREKINWYYTLVGLFLLFGYFYSKQSAVSDNDLNKMTITLSHPIEFLKGGARVSHAYHRLWTKETKAAFITDSPGEIAASRAALDSLKQGDTLTIKYSSQSEHDLQNNAKEILIYSLQKLDRSYFDITTYNRSKAAYDKRWRWVMLIGGVLLVLRGLTVINLKTSYILGGLSLATVIVLKLLDKF
jgi:hypothetical protein